MVRIRKGSFAGFRRAVVVVLILGTMICAQRGALAAAPAAIEGLDPSSPYRITFQAGEQSASTLSPVYIQNFVEIGGRKLLVVTMPGYQTKGYIAWDSIRAILPNQR